jgi:hypothetical protein
MKYFYTLLSLCFVSLLSSQTLIQQQNFNSAVTPDLPSGFTPSVGVTTNWNTNNPASGNSSGYTIASGGSLVRCPRGGNTTYTMTTETFSSVGFVNVILSFGRRIQGSTSGANAYTASQMLVEWSDNGGTSWQTLLSSVSATTSWNQFNTNTIGATADNNANLRFRFTLTGTSAAQNISNAFWIDDIAIQGDPTNVIEFFSKPTGLLDDLSTWGGNTDGTGPQPISFSEDDYIFHVANGNNGTIGSDLTIDGLSAQFIIESGASFTIPAGLRFDNCASCAVIDVNGGGTLKIDNLTQADYPKFGSLASGSTIDYGGAGNQIVLGSILYSNLRISGSGTKTCQAGQDVEVDGDFDLQSGNTFELHKTGGNTNSFILVGSSLGSGGQIDADEDSRFVIGGAALASGNISFTGTSVLGILDFQATNTTLGVESNLTIDNLIYAVGNQSILQVLNASKITIGGEITGNPRFAGSSEAELEINSSLGGGVNSFNISMQIDPGDPFLNAFKNFTINRPSITATLTNEVIVLNDVNISAGTLASGGNLTLHSDAQGTARILALDPPNSDVTGNVNVNRFNASGFTGWLTMAIPVKGADFNSLDDDIAITCPSCPDGSGAGGGDFTSVYSYDETQSGAFDDFNSYVPLADINDPMDNGLGYYVYFGDGTATTNDITWDASGPIAKSEVRLSISATPGFNGLTFDDANDGLNFVGNPYPAPISWDEVFNVTSADPGNGPDPIFNVYYIWSADQNAGAGGFYSYVDGTPDPPGLMDPDGIIPVGQGFFVQSQGPAPRVLDLVIQESAKSVLNTSSYLKTAQLAITKKQDCYLKLTRYADGKNVNTTITFKDMATTGKDIKYDAVHKNGLPAQMLINPNVMNFYTILNGEKYSINAIPPVNGSLSMDLFTKVGSTGVYGISAKNFEAIPEGYCLDLYDKTMQTHHDLKASDYVCTLNKEDIHARFILTFSNNAFKISTSSNEPTCNSSNTGTIEVNVKGDGLFNYTWRNADNQIIKETKNSALSSNTIENLTGGKYKVEVTRIGECATAISNIEVKGSLSANADFSTSDNNVIATNGIANVVFANLSNNASSLVWNFGDGKTLSSSNTATVSHNYEKEGVYKVILEAKNESCGDVSVIEKYISIKDPEGLSSKKAKALDNVKIWKDQNDVLHLVFDDVMSNGTIEIHNLVGQKLFEHSLKNNQQKEILIKDISQAIYQQIGIVKLKSSTKEVAKRIAF